MFWFVILGIAFALMSFSQKAWGNPLTIIGFGCIAFCITALLGVALKTIGMSLG
ncbi:hypothetical protein [Methylobacterium sp. Leaf99]|uniref:hypothetical protein n=1 Tax=Methylobacterium sp. Leaf99 TaxID=1736251 RepID=UPI000A8E82D9|nr:hypothetical protein [Methylobacterium sp. Leaf99]